MGLLDFLKKLSPPAPPVNNPTLAMEPQCVRHRWFTLRLPLGWRFTEADGFRATASGPGGCSADFFLAIINKEKALEPEEFEQNRKVFVQLMGAGHLDGKTGGETMLPTGVAWMETIDTYRQKRRLRIALLNTRPRNRELSPAILQVTCTIPEAAADDGFGAERFEVLRTALRSIEWT